MARNTEQHVSKREQLRSKNKNYKATKEKLKVQSKEGKKDPTKRKGALCQSLFLGPKATLPFLLSFNKIIIFLLSRVNILFLIYYIFIDAVCAELKKDPGLPNLAPFKQTFTARLERIAEKSERQRDRQVTHSYLPYGPAQATTNVEAWCAKCDDVTEEG